MMRETLDRHAARHDRMLRIYLSRNFRTVDQDDVVSDSFFRVVRKLDELEERRLDLERKSGEKIPKEAWLFGCLRWTARHRAIKIINSPRVKRTVQLESELSDEDGRIFRHQGATVWPEQEDVVFRKQLLSLCAGLPPEERVVMSMAFDRATLEEMLLELGVSKTELIARRARAFARLKAVATSAENAQVRSSQQLKRLSTEGRT